MLLNIKICTEEGNERQDIRLAYDSENSATIRSTDAVVDIVQQAQRDYWAQKYQRPIASISKQVEVLENLTNLIDEAVRHFNQTGAFPELALQKGSDHLKGG